MFERIGRNARLCFAYNHGRYRNKIAGLNDDQRNEDKQVLEIQLQMKSH